MGAAARPDHQQKKRVRFTVTGIFSAVVVALFLLGNYFYKILMGITA